MEVDLQIVRRGTTGQIFGLFRISNMPRDHIEAFCNRYSVGSALLAESRCAGPPIFLPLHLRAT